VGDRFDLLLKDVFRLFAEPPPFPKVGAGDYTSLTETVFYTVDVVSSSG
jgi:hypothetical protein